MKVVAADMRETFTAWKLECPRQPPPKFNYTEHVYGGWEHRHCTICKAITCTNEMKALQVDAETFDKYFCRRVARHAEFLNKENL